MGKIDIFMLTLGIFWVKIGAWLIRKKMELMAKEGYDYCFDACACASCGGHCCTGESGYIWVNYSEIEAIAAFLERSIEDFATIHLKKVKHRYSLIERKREKEDDFACIFFDDAAQCCSIYPVRPLQCRTFPFWDQFKNDINEVQKECPGIIIKA